MIKIIKTRCFLAFLTGAMLSFCIRVNGEHKINKEKTLWYNGFIWHKEVECKGYTEMREICSERQLILIDELSDWRSAAHRYGFKNACQMEEGLRELTSGQKR